MTPPHRTAVIGLGSMGFGIATSCLRADHVTHGFDVSDHPIDRFLSEGGSPGRLADVASTLDSVVVVVLNGDQMEDVLFGDSGVVPLLSEGAVVVACPTFSPDVARDLERRCVDHRVLYLDAPISGGSAKASTGELSVMASGAPAAFVAAQPVLDAIAETVFALGDEAGAGSAMKAVNQLLAGVHIAAMAEALTFGITQGVAPDRFVEVISKCAGTSWMLENRAPHIVDGDYTPHSQVDIWPKDLGIVLDIAQSADFKAPITAAALEQFQAASNAGLGAEDDAAIAKIYADQAGITLPKTS